MPEPAPGARLHAPWGGRGRPRGGDVQQGERLHQCSRAARGSSLARLALLALLAAPAAWRSAIAIRAAAWTRLDRARAQGSQPSRRASDPLGHLPPSAAEHRARRRARAVRAQAADRRRPDRRPGRPQGLRLPELVGRARLRRAAAPTSSTSATPRSPTAGRASSRRPSRTTTARARTWSPRHARSSRATCWPSTTRPTARTSRRALRAGGQDRRRLRPLRRHRPGQPGDARPGRRRPVARRLATTRTRADARRNSYH